MWQATGKGRLAQGQVTQPVITAGGHAGTVDIFLPVVPDGTQNLIHTGELFSH